jgi:arylsulfatase A-like enzyme
MSRRVARSSLARCAATLATAAALLLLSGCGAGDDASDGAGDGAARGAASDPRPSIVLVVIESLRTDVVASYGRDASSPFAAVLERARASTSGSGDARASATPRLDALAAEGTRHAWAFTDSPESVASHASIFTGLRVDEHGVGIFGRPTAPPELATLAEFLAEAGYQTAGFSENPMIGPDFGLSQGFARFSSPSATQFEANVRAGRPAHAGFDAVAHATRWLASRDPARPYFLFVNLADPHFPFGLPTHPEFLPEGASETRIANVLADAKLRDRICEKLPDPETLAILRGVYASRVAQADTKLGAILDRAHAEGAEPITIVTADHGSHFGEHALLGHRFEVDHRALHVPLVVAGPGVAPRVGTTAVALDRIHDTIRCLAGDAEACAEALPGKDAGEDEAILSIEADERALLPVTGAFDTGSLAGDSLHGRVHCPADALVSGRAVSLIRFPMKLVWRSGGHYRLHDLSWDPAERADQLERQPAIAARMRAELDRFVAEKGIAKLRGHEPEAPLPARARATFDAARATLLAAERTEVDAVWFAQLVLRVRPDPELAAWVATHVALHEGEPFHRIIDPGATSRHPLPDEPGHGIARWSNLLLASVEEPEQRALRWLAEYLEPDESGYILTHQLTALVWAEAIGRPLPESLRGKRAHYLARIAAEQARDAEFSDLWVERAALLAAFGRPDGASLAAAAERIVENHLGNGDFGDGASEIQYDGHTLVADHQREHLRGLAMIVLAHYLAGVEPPAATPAKLRADMPADLPARTQARTDQAPERSR